MQTVFQFSFETTIKLADRPAKRFLLARQIVDKIRSGLGRAISDIADDELELGYLSGVQPDKTGQPQRIHDAPSIAKWYAELHELKDEDPQVKGKIVLILETEPAHPDETIQQLVVMAAHVNNIKLRSGEIIREELDYETTDDPVTYTIDGYLPGLQAPSSIRDDREAVQALVKKNYPIGHDPNTQKTLSQSCGKAIKRHLLENAVHHGLPVEVLSSAILVVKAYWIAHPVKGGRKANNRQEACRIIFQLPFKLSGTWFAGSYRHKGMGRIIEAPGLAKNINGGVFIL